MGKAIFCACPSRLCLHEFLEILGQFLGSDAGAAWLHELSHEFPIILWVGGMPSSLVVRLLMRLYISFSKKFTLYLFILCAASSALSNTSISLLYRKTISVRCVSKKGLIMGVPGGATFFVMGIVYEANHMPV